METLLLGIYAFFVWLIFFKYKWLPWTFISQCIVITIPIVGLTVLILLLNIGAPSSHDVRVINYVVAVNPRVNGIVSEVPIEPNRPIKKGEVLFKLDPTPFQIAVQSAQAQLSQLKVQLITAQANTRNYADQVKVSAGQKEAIAAKLALSRQRLQQYKDLLATGAGSAFEYEQAQAEVTNYEAQLAAATATESQARSKVAAKTSTGEQDEIANVKAQIANAETQLANAKWNLDQTEYRAPADGTVVSLALRPGAMAVQLPMVPAMTFVEKQQWIMAIYAQNEVRRIKPGQEAEIALKMYPGRVIKCKVDSIMWATSQGQLPIGGASTTAGIAPIPPGRLAVRLLAAPPDEDLFLASGAAGAGAVFTDSFEEIHILRKVIIRLGAKIDWLILKLH